MNTIAGTCGKCGAPYYIPITYHGVCPPAPIPTCRCWNQTVIKQDQHSFDAQAQSLKREFSEEALKAFDLDLTEEPQKACSWEHPSKAKVGSYYEIILKYLKTANYANRTEVIGKCVGMGENNGLRFKTVFITLYGEDEIVCIREIPFDLEWFEKEATDGSVEEMG